MRASSEDRFPCLCPLTQPVVRRERVARPPTPRTDGCVGSFARNEAPHSRESRWWPARARLARSPHAPRAPRPPTHTRARADAARPAPSGALAPSRQQPKSLPGLLLFSPVKLPGGGVGGRAVASAAAPAAAAPPPPPPRASPAAGAPLRPDALSTGLKAQPVVLTAAGDRAELQPVHNVRLVSGRDVDVRSCRDFLTGGPSGAPATPDDPFLVMWQADGRTKAFMAAPLAALRDVRRGTAGVAIFRFMQERRLGADFSARCLALVFSSSAAGSSSCGGTERQLELVLDSSADMGSAYEQLCGVREGLERRRLLAAAVSMPPPPPPPPRRAVAPKLVPVAFPFAGSVVVAPGQTETTPQWVSAAAAAQRARLKAAASVALAQTPSATLARAPLPASAAPGRSSASSCAAAPGCDEGVEEEEEEDVGDDDDDKGMPRAPVPPTPGGAIRSVSLLPAHAMPAAATGGGGAVLTSPMNARVPRGKRTAHATTPGRVVLLAAAAPTPTMAEITRAPAAAVELGVDADAMGELEANAGGATERRVTFASPRLDLSRLATMGARARAGSIDELLDGHVSDDGDDDETDEDAPLDTERSALSTASCLTGVSRSSSSSATPANLSSRGLRTPCATTARKTPHASRGTEQRRLFATSSAYGSLMAVSAALPEDAEWSDKDRALYWHGMIWDVVANDQVDQFSLELDDGESRVGAGVAGWSGCVAACVHAGVR